LIFGGVTAANTWKRSQRGLQSLLNDIAARRAKLERDPAYKGQGPKILLRIFDDERSYLE
jgi:hypothetical protein